MLVNEMNLMKRLNKNSLESENERLHIFLELKQFPKRLAYFSNPSEG